MSSDILLDMKRNLHYPSLVPKAPTPQSPSSSSIDSPPRTDIVIGLVYALGTNYSSILEELRDHIKAFGYTPEPIRLSECLEMVPSLGASRATEPEGRRIAQFMDAGDKARKRSKNEAAVALLAVKEIFSRRKKTPSIPKAYILYSLKHNKEVAVLRQIYGPGFYLVGIHASEPERFRFLTETKRLPKDEANRLMDRDQSVKDAFGQQNRKTFALADAFVHQDDRKEIVRFIDLIFGDPFSTPTRHEYGMFFAYAASTRSGDLSRQVGAAIVTPHGELIGVGTNDVPKYNGGLYWERDENDQRDLKLGYDSNFTEKEKIKDEIVKELKLLLKLRAKPGIIRRALENTRLPDITEFGRAVHAEMEALLSCARTGASPRGATLYTTTFPCHNCAKHIIAAGISSIKFIEPYTKSKALDLHSDAIELVQTNSEPPETKKVHISHFSGIGPRRYLDLFSLKITALHVPDREKDGKKKAWAREVATPRIPLMMGPIDKIEKGAWVKILDKLVTPRTRSRANKKTGAKK